MTAQSQRTPEWAEALHRLRAAAVSLQVGCKERLSRWPLLLRGRSRSSTFRDSLTSKQFPLERAGPFLQSRPSARHGRHIVSEGRIMEMHSSAWHPRRSTPTTSHLDLLVDPVRGRTTLARYRDRV